MFAAGKKDNQSISESKHSRSYLMDGAS